MKIFCAYAFTGENEHEVRSRMRLVVDTLKSAGHDAYCNLDDPYLDTIDDGDINKIFNRAFLKLSKNEAVVAIVTSPNRSVGQIMEIGAGLSQSKPLYLFEHKSAVDSSYLSKLAEKNFVWKVNEDLAIKLQEL